MKIISTIAYLYFPVITILKEYGLENSHRQFRVCCRCRGLAHGNELCQDLGHKVFAKDYAGQTFNAKTLQYFEQHPEVTYIIQHNIFDNIIVNDLQLKEKLKEYKDTD